MRKLRSVLLSKGFAAVAVLCLLFVGAAALLAAEKVEPEKKSEKGYLGVSIEKVPHQDLKDLGISHGVRVTDVAEGEAADKAGIKEDDVIQFFADEKIRSSADLVDAVRAKKPGTKVDVKLVRDGKFKTVAVTVGELKLKTWFGPKDFLFQTGKGGYLGVQLHSLNKDLAKYFGVKPDEGALILKVEEKSPAEEAGLKAGDVIVELDGEDVAGPQGVSEILADLKKGDKIEVKVIRHKKPQSVKAELGAGHGFGYFFKSPTGVGKVAPLLNYFNLKVPKSDDYRIFWYDKSGKAREELKERVRESAKRAREAYKKAKEAKDYIYI